MNTICCCLFLIYLYGPKMQQVSPHRVSARHITRIDQMIMHREEDLAEFVSQNNQSVYIRKV